MKIRTLVGSVLILSGIGFMGLAGFNMFEAFERNAQDAEAVRVSEDACKEEIVKIGTFVPQGDDKIEVILSDTEDPRMAMGDLTSILAACPTRREIASCIGTTCMGNGQPGPMRATIILGLR